MNVPFDFQTAHAEADEITLLDSGTTENFIDEHTWQRMGVGKKPLPKKIKVFNVDGTENKQGEMTHFCRLRILYNGKEDLQDFYIMDLGKDRLILGYPFLRMFNPQINWVKGKLKEGRLRIQSALYKHLDQLVERLQRKARKMGNLRQDEAVFIRRTTIAQNKPVLKENPIPEQYQKYSNVFL